MSGATVLVVDDDASVRALLAQFLEEEGYQPIPCDGGVEAMACLDPAGPLPDVILLDLKMPKVSGYDVLEYLRRNLWPELPVLIFSAQRPEASLLGALDAESRDFIAKPFELEELLIRLQRLLQRSARSAGRARGVLRVYTLGSLRVYRDDALVFDEGWRNKPAKTIFKLLFTYPGRRYPKDVLLEELWPEADPDVAANRLRVAIHELRKMLGARRQKDQTPTYIGQQEGTYFFDPATPFWSDVQTFEEGVARGHELAQEENLDEALHAYHRAEVLYQGDYLRDDPFLEWTVATRERLRETHLAMLADVARIYALRGENEQAAGFCRKILRIEPWREEVYRRLMEYLVAAGRPHEALRAFDECRRALRAEIEAEPSPETVRLRDQIAAPGRRGSAVTTSPASDQDTP